VSATVAWQVNGIPGGNATVGTISASGMYVSPAAMPSPASVSITATSTSDSSETGNATVNLSPGSVSATPPTISGTPASSVVVGQAYSFTPTASAPPGTSLSFTITNKPAWATFNSATGQLTGTPTTAEIGTDSGIAIAVSDGTESASLAAFAITVLGAPTGSATVSWTQPTLRTDGSALTNLAGYHIYYGTAPGTYTTTIDVSSPGTTSYVVTGLPTGTTYYFVASAYDASGNESAYTPVASKAVL
jgi:hypothetical protein